MVDVHARSPRPRLGGPRRARLLIASGCALALVSFLLFVHPFLAVDAPVQADTLVIEGWVPVYVVDRAIAEIARGPYIHVFVSGMESDSAQSMSVVRRLVAAGIAPDRIVPAPAPEVSFNRTSHMARAVRDRMRELRLEPHGVNVVTLGPHARQTRLAYTRLLGSITPVGVISVPKDDYVPAWWWASSAGIKKTTKDFAGWLKEVVFGLRS